MTAVPADALQELIDALRSTVRMLDAVRYSGGLHGNQIERLNQAKATIKKISEMSDV